MRLHVTTTWIRLCKSTSCMSASQSYLWVETSPSLLVSQAKSYITYFTPTKSDTSLFVRFTPSHTLLVLVYVNDILITGLSLSANTTLISSLNSCFALKDLGDLHHFLGIQVTRTFVSFFIKPPWSPPICNLHQWSPLFVSNKTRPLPFMILLSIGQSLVLSSIFLSLVLNSPTRSTKLLSSCMLPKIITGKLLSVSYAILQALFIMVFFFTVPPSRSPRFCWCRLGCRLWWSQVHHRVLCLSWFQPYRLVHPQVEMCFPQQHWSWISCRRCCHSWTSLAPVASSRTSHTHIHS